MIATRTRPAGMDVPLALAVRAQCTGNRLSTRLAERVHQRLALRDGERGAQTAEYAMLGGVGAAACTVLYQMIRRPEFLERILRLITDIITRSVRLWA
jgi:hypothetical protein